MLTGGLTSSPGAQGVLRRESRARAGRPTESSRASTRRPCAVGRCRNERSRSVADRESTRPSTGSPCGSDTWSRHAVQTCVKGAMRAVRPTRRATVIRRRALVEVGSLRVHVHAPSRAVGPRSFAALRPVPKQTGGADPREGCRAGGEACTAHLVERFASSNSRPSAWRVELESCRSPSYPVCVGRSQRVSRPSGADVKY